MRLILYLSILVLNCINFLFSYSISVKEPIVGFLYKTSIIDDINYISVNSKIVTIEIQSPQVYTKSWPCKDIIHIKDNWGVKINFDCSNLEKEIILGKSKSENIKDDEILTNSNNPNENKLKDEMIRMGYRYRIEFNREDIIIKDNNIKIYTNGRRTNVESTLIKCFWLCGYAMDIFNANYNNVEVIINIDKGKGERLTASTEGIYVKKIGKSRSPGISSFSSFLNKLTINRNN